MLTLWREKREREREGLQGLGKRYKTSYQNTVEKGGRISQKQDTTTVTFQTASNQFKQQA